MTPARTLAANHAQKAAHRAKVEEAQKLAAEIAAEQRARADEEGRAVRAHIRFAKQREAPEDVEDVEQGPTNLLARDGLLWLVRKRRINLAQRNAAEDYRKFFTVIFAGGGRSCIGDSTGGNANTHGADDLPPLRNAAAREQLDRARRVGLAGDERLIALVDAVAGRGETLRELAKGDKDAAAILETELRVALRFLARHWGYAS